MAYYLLIQRKWDRLIVKQVDEQNADLMEEDAPVVFEHVCGSDTTILAVSEEVRVMPDSDGCVRIVL